MWQWIADIMSPLYGVLSNFGVLPGLPNFNFTVDEDAVRRFMLRIAEGLIGGVLVIVGVLNLIRPAVNNEAKAIGSVL